LATEKTEKQDLGERINFFLEKEGEDLVLSKGEGTKGVEEKENQAFNPELDWREKVGISNSLFACSGGTVVRTSLRSKRRALGKGLSVPTAAKAHYYPENEGTHHKAHHTKNKQTHFQNGGVLLPNLEKLGKKDGHE